MKECNKQIGLWLKEKRNEKGYSTYYVAEKLGKSKSLIVLWENAKRVIDASDFIDYCKVLNANPVELMEQLFRK